MKARHNIIITYSPTFLTFCQYISLVNLKKTETTVKFPFYLPE